MKKIITLILLACLMLGISAAAEGEAHSDTLVVYFSCTGTTKSVAEKIAGITGADLYEIPIPTRT